MMCSWCVHDVFMPCGCGPPALEKALNKALAKLDDYLLNPLPGAQNEEGGRGSTRRYLDGDDLTLADCNLLPKLHVVKVTTNLVTISFNYTNNTTYSN